MKKRLLLTLALVSISISLIAQTIAPTRIARASSLPAHCTKGDAFYKTSATEGLYLCTATDTWSLQTTAGGGGGTTTLTSVILQPQGRLTLTSATPYLTSTVTAATTVYYTPAAGNFVPIYDGSSWNTISFSELSQATTDSTKSPAAAGTYSNYDIFVWSDSGTLRATRGPAWTFSQTFTVTIASPAVFTSNSHGLYECEPVVFSTTGALPTGLTAGTTYFTIATGLTANAFEVSTSCGGAAVNTSGTQSGTHTLTQNSTVRGTGSGTTELEFVNGLLMNKQSITNGPAADRGTYVGSMRTNGSSQVDLIFGGSGGAGGESTTLGLWNMYNRRVVSLNNFDNTDSWTYTTALYRVRNNNPNNRIQYLIGYQGDMIDVVSSAIRGNSGSLVLSLNGIGANSMNTVAAGSIRGQQQLATGANGGASAFYRTVGPLGANYVAPLEWSAASGTQTWQGDTGSTEAENMITLTTTF